jgi:hypothetical protein
MDVTDEHLKFPPFENREGWGSLIILNSDQDFLGLDVVIQGELVRMRALADGIDFF